MPIVLLLAQVMFLFSCTAMDGHYACADSGFIPDVFFLSVLLFLGTFFVAVTLKDFKQSSIFPTFVRQLVSDFAVLISIIVFVVVDILIGINTPKLRVPDKFQVIIAYLC